MPHLKSYILHLLPSLLLFAAWTGCSRTPVINKDAIYMAGDVEIYPDSIVIGGHSYTAISRSEITDAWTAAPCHTAAAAMLPALTSSSRMAEALYAKGLSRYHDIPLSSLDIFLSGAILDPQRSMETLRAMAPDGILPANRLMYDTDKQAWAKAAFETYLTSGSEAWLKEVYRIISATYSRDITSLKAENGMLHGLPDYAHQIKGYTPSWMTPIDEFQVISLTTNAWHYATLNTAAEIAGILKRKAKREWENKASKIRNDINDHFWVPTSSYYGQYMYGDLYPVLSASADNFANILAVLLGIPSPEMSSRIITSCHMLPEGVPAVYPTPAEGEAIIDPRVQTLYGIAASRTGNEQALLAAIGNVWRMSLSKDCHAEWPTLLLRGLMGISLTADGMTFAPIIPQQLGPELSLSGLRYRRAVFDVNIHGSGDKIASFAIDSVRQHSPLLPPGLKGHHKIDIVMSGNRLSGSSSTAPSQPATAGPQAKSPATPRIQWTDSHNGKILNFAPDTNYEVYVNGILTETINTPDYTVTDTGTAVIDIVPVANGMSGFAPRSHVSAPDSARIHIPATAITPRRAPTHLIHHRETAAHYIELAARHNTRLTFYVQAPADGEYFINIAYSNGTTETAMRSLEVNDSYAGTFVCPQVKHTDWITTSPSSTLTATLHKGVNKLSLTYINTTILLHDIYLLKK